MAIDQLSKAFIRTNLNPDESIEIIRGVFYITHLRNKGAAFGLLPGFQKLILIVSFIVIISIVVLYFTGTIRDTFLKLAFGLVLGGSLGNMVDRLFLGEVIDFFDFRISPVFNIADAAIIVGIVLIFYRYVILERKELKDAPGSN